jgi:hypothetical protein
VSRFILSCSAFLGLVLISLALAAPARAEGRCPPGFYPTGGGNAGWEGCAPMGPIEQEPEYEEESGGYYDELPPRSYPSAEELQAMAEASIKAEQWREDERMKDPVYRKLKEGYWYYPEGDEAKGDVCVATFMSTKGGAVMMDWAGDQKGTFLAFFGAGIPRAEKIKTVKVSLIQSGETQTVKAFHAPFFSSEELGMIMFAVPSTDALLTSIEDVQDFEVMQSGQTLILGEWHSGHEARDFLTGCVTARTP